MSHWLLDPWLVGLWERDTFVQDWGQNIVAILCWPKSFLMSHLLLSLVAYRVFLGIIVFLLHLWQCRKFISMCKVFAAKKNSKSLSRKYCIRRFKPVFKTFSTLVKKVRINLRLVNCRIMKKFQFLIILKASTLTWRVIRGTYKR